MKETATPFPAVAESKIWRGTIERQLPFVLRAIAALAFLVGAVLKAEPQPLTVTEELQGIQLAKLALATEIAATPDGPDAEQIRKLDRLADAYLGVVKRHPDSPEARLAAGSFLWSLKRFDEAKNQWDAAARLDPDNPELAYSFGVWHLANGDTVEAAETFARAVALQPENALYHHSLGNTLFVFRHQNAGADGPSPVMQRALVHLRRATELAPLSVEFARGYAETFYGMPEPDWNAALEAWRHFLEITDDKDFAYTHLARVSIQLGDRKQAKAYLERITGPRYDRVKDKLVKRLEGK
jgi:tetratricopeptide (TPR) repeat protein